MADLNRCGGPDVPMSEEVGIEIENLFQYHPWDDAKVNRGKIVKDALIAAYKAIIENVPPCPTRTRALNKIVDARMDANAAITHEGRY